MPLAEFCLIFLCHFHVMKAFTDEMKRLCVTDATSLLTLVQKMLRCGSEETFKTTLETIRNQFPTFHAYLDDNWLPHRALFAGYKRRGVLHLDNHTNNRLERYHHTIKTVVRSSQVSVGTLVDCLQRIISVRSVAMLHSDFNRKLKTSSNNSDIKQYEASVSAFAASHIVSAYEAAAKLTGTPARTTHSPSDPTPQLTPRVPALLTPDLVCHASISFMYASS